MSKWLYEIDIAESFNKARTDETKIPALTKEIAEKIKALNLDIDSYIQLKLDITIKKLRKTKKFKSFNAAWDDFYVIANHIRLWVKTS